MDQSLPILACTVLFPFVLGYTIGRMIAAQHRRSAGGAMRKLDLWNVDVRPIGYLMAIPARHHTDSDSNEPDYFVESHATHLSDGLGSHDITVNPASGLVMIGGIGGLDVGGHSFGSNDLLGESIHASCLDYGYSSETSIFSGIDHDFYSSTDSSSTFDHSSFDHDFSCGSSTFSGDW